MNVRKDGACLVEEGMELSANGTAPKLPSVAVTRRVRVTAFK